MAQPRKTAARRRDEVAQGNGRARGRPSTGVHPRHDDELPERGLRRVFEAMPACFALFAGTEHRVEYVNPAMAALWNHRATAGLPMPAAFPELAAAGYHSRWDEVLREGMPRELSEAPVQLPGRVGPERNAWFDFFLVPRFDDAGLPCGVAAFGLDVTARVRARDDFFSVATHEIRTPLATLGLKLDLLSRAAHRHEAMPSSMVLAALDVARRQIQRLTTLTDNLLDMARAADGKLVLEPAEMDLSEAVRDAVEKLAEHAQRAGCTVTLDLTEPLRGRWDRVRVGQVATNLLSNALKFGAGRTVRVRTVREGSAAVLTVADEGVGIAPADQARIFERFERASGAPVGSSLGLGLYVVRELVCAHGGTVTVHSAPGAGATFRVELPAEPAPAPGGPAATRA